MVLLEWFLLYRIYGAFAYIYLEIYFSLIWKNQCLCIGGFCYNKTNSYINEYEYWWRIGKLGLKHSSQFMLCFNGLIQVPCQPQVKFPRQQSVKWSISWNRSFGIVQMVVFRSLWLVMLHSCFVFLFCFVLLYRRCKVFKSSHKIGKI